MSPAIFFLALLGLTAVSGGVFANTPRGSVITDVFVGTKRIVHCPRKACAEVEKNDGESTRARINAGEKNLCNCVCDGFYNTMLHVSALEECITCSDVLLDKPTSCDVDALDVLDRTPLIDASRVCQVVMINLYLDHGADPDAKDFAGMTPLCYAALYDDPICGGAVKDLIEKGADCKIACDAFGKIPSEIAVNQITKDIFKQKKC